MLLDISKNYESLLKNQEIFVLGVMTRKVDKDFNLSVDLQLQSSTPAF